MREIIFFPQFLHIFKSTEYLWSLHVNPFLCIRKKEKKIEITNLYFAVMKETLLDDALPDFIMCMYSKSFRFLMDILMFSILL